MRAVIIGVLLLCSAAAVAAGRPWGVVRSWAYQLQKMDLDALSHSPYDLIVMDYSKDGSESGQFGSADIARLQHGAGGRKLVLAYMSIGEAESYRFYWKEAWRPGQPTWLGAENPEWPGNYRVQYWNPQWRAILCGPGGYLERIMAAGFDGVYLDIVDGYEDWEAEGHREARSQMEALVTRIARQARQKDPDFGVFPQNGEALLEDRPYLETITGIGKEDLFYGAEHDNQGSAADETAEALRDLDRAVAAGKLVLNVDYCTDAAKMTDARTQAARHGYIEYCAVRALDRLTTQP